MRLFLSAADVGCGPGSLKRRVAMASPTRQEALLTRKVRSQWAEGPAGQVAVRQFPFLLFGDSVRGPGVSAWGTLDFASGRAVSSGGAVLFPR